MNNLCSYTRTNPNPRDSDHVRNDVKLAFELLLVDFVFMIINVPIIPVACLASVKTLNVLTNSISVQILHAMFLFTLSHSSFVLITFYGSMWLQSNTYIYQVLYNSELEQKLIADSKYLK